MTAVTFADPDCGPRYLADYAKDLVPVSGVFQRRFKQTAKRLRIPDAEVEFIDRYMKEWLHPLTHPAAKAISVTLIALNPGVMMGNCFDPKRADDYRRIAANIVNVAERIKSLLRFALPGAYLASL